MGNGLDATYLLNRSAGEEIICELLLAPFGTRGVAKRAIKSNIHHIHFLLCRRRPARSQRSILSTPCRTLRRRLSAPLIPPNSDLRRRPNPLQVEHPQTELPRATTFVRGPFALFEIDQLEAASADHGLGTGIAGLDVLVG